MDLAADSNAAVEYIPQRFENTHLLSRYLLVTYSFSIESATKIILGSQSPRDILLFNGIFNEGITLEMIT